MQRASLAAFMMPEQDKMRQTVINQEESTYPFILARRNISNVQSAEQNIHRAASKCIQMKIYLESLCNFSVRNLEAKYEIQEKE
jgi:hypothetical protein